MVGELNTSSSVAAAPRVTDSRCSSSVLMTPKNAFRDSRKRYTGSPARARLLVVVNGAGVTLIPRRAVFPSRTLPCAVAYGVLACSNASVARHLSISSGWSLRFGGVAVEVFLHGGMCGAETNRVIDFLRSLPSKPVVCVGPSFASVNQRDRLSVGQLPWDAVRFSAVAGSGRVMLSRACRC